MDKIKQLEEKIAFLKEGSATSDSAWSVLDEKTRGLNEAEAAVINSREAVNTARADMMHAFINFYLFPKYREEFISIPTFRPLCLSYISAVTTAKDEGVKSAIELEAENKRLKEELARLKNDTETDRA